MTVETQVKKVGPLPGNGVATSFSFSPMVIFNSSDLLVIKTDANGDDETLSEGTSSTTYSVSVTDYPGTGSITYPASGGTPLAADEYITIKRVLPILQETDLENGGGYFADVQEAALDRLTMIDLQQQEAIDRSLQLPVSVSGVSTELPAPEAGAVLGWNDDEDAIVNVLGADTISVPVSIANGGTGQTTADAAFTALKQAATESTAGVAEIATQTEVDTGTDDTKFVTPLKLANWSGFSIPENVESFIYRVVPIGNTLATGTNLGAFYMPYDFTISAVYADVDTAQSSGNAVTVDINDGGTTILSTKLTIDNTETSSRTAATPAVISDSAISAGARVSFDIDNVGNGTAKGLTITIVGSKTT